MNRTEIFAYLVIPLPVEIEYGRSNNYNLHYKKLLSLPLSLKFSLSDYGLFDSDINVISQSSNEHDLIKDMYNPSTGRKEVILKISLLKSVPFNDSFIRRDPFNDEVVEIKGKYAISLHKSTICERFIEQINDFIILMNIAIPGSIMCSQGFVFQDSEFLENINAMFSNIEEAYFHCSSKKWPKFYYLQMQDVWKWATGQKDFNGGFSNSQIGRALNSYSYLFGNLNREYDLFWAIQGIESLYLNDEKLEITSKLNTRIQLFIGDIKIDKKLIKTMYKFRSQFVHGTRNIIRSYYSRESEKIIKSDIEYYHTECIAEGILLATFQELVKRNYSSLSFSTIVNSTKNQPNPQYQTPKAPKDRGKL